MNIAIIGYGRMGHEIEKILIGRGHSVSLKIDVDNRGDLNSTNLSKTDVAVEFSAPSAALDNILTCLECGIPVVSGTTGWLEHKEKVEDLCRANKSSFFYASNYSIGVNLMFEINQRLAILMNKFPQYDVSMVEKHHVHKLDAPSGTALSLAGQILEHLDRKKTWDLAQKEKDTLHIEAIREGEITGVHEVTYTSETDKLVICHEATSRKAFAMGAVLAAEFLKGKVGLFGMKDLLNI